MGSGKTEILVKNATALGYCNAMQELVSLEWSEVNPDE